MDLVALRYFVETARIGNLTKAAEKLKISPSAVHRQIKMLESELGIQLYNRTYYGLTLTSAGNELYSRALEILRLSDETVRKLSGSRYEINEPLSIAFMDDTFSKEIVNYIRGFKQQHPQIKMQLYSGVRKHAKALLENKNADVAYLYYYNTPEGVDYINTGINKPVGILMRADDKLKDKVIDNSVLNNIPLIAPQTEASNKDKPAKSPYDPDKVNIIAETDSLYSFRELVVLGSGYIFCIEPTDANVSGPDLVFRPLYPRHSVDLYLIKKDHPLHEESASAFFEYMRSIYAPAKQEE